MQKRPRSDNLVEGDDAALFDMLLHSRDTPFTVDSILAMARQAGNVRVLDFVPSMEYEPAHRLRPPPGGAPADAWHHDARLAALTRFARYILGAPRIVQYF